VEDDEMQGLFTKIAGAIAISAALATMPAAADDYEILRTECAKQLKLSSSGCECVVDSARAELNDEERSLVVAHVTRDQNGITSLQQGMTGDSVMKVVTFMATTPQKCASS
jgi:hypothetical protein